jgi:phospholipase C
LPFVLISKWAKPNYIDHRMLDQSSIIRFIEDNWSLGRLGGDSNDAKAGTVDGMFDFDHKDKNRVTLDPATGEVTASW